MEARRIPRVFLDPEAFGTSIENNLDECWDNEPRPEKSTEEGGLTVVSGDTSFFVDDCDAGRIALHKLHLLTDAGLE